MNTHETRWGILSTGRIAHDFVTALRYAPGARVAAVSSRSVESAQSFIDENKLTGAVAYGSPEELAGSELVDIIYVASPHSHHYQHMKTCLEHGKNVLCEKAFTLTAAQTREVIELARAKGVFLMEAMWTRYLPAIRALVETHLPRIGDVTMVQADFGFVDPGVQRLSDPHLGGGALLDIGVYSLTFPALAYGGMCDGCTDRRRR